MVAQTFFPPGHQRLAIGGMALSAPTRNSNPDQYDKLDDGSNAAGTCLLSTQTDTGTVEPADSQADVDDAGDRDYDDDAPTPWYFTR
jgi:hypothetical protein